MTQHNSRKPRWQIIHDELRERIESGEFTETFPGELDLAAHYSVSRGTIRQALRGLRESGLVSHRRGRQAQVVNRHSNSSFGPIYSLYEVIRESGMDDFSTILDQSVRRCKAAAEVLELEPDARLFHLARVRHAGGRPLAMDELWMPMSIAEPLLSVDFAHTAVYKELRQLGGIILGSGQENVTAVSATVEQSAMLQCAVGAALLKVERVSCFQGHPVEFRRTYIVGERFSFVRTFDQAISD